MEQPIPIPTLHLFPVLDRLLIDLLRSLSPEDWNRPTMAKLWTVKDIAAHLLDGNVRGIAALHGYKPTSSAQLNSYQDLINYLNQLNATWVNSMKRVSPQLLTDQLESTGPQYIQYLNTLAPFEQAEYAVAWAGEERSLNWFHIAREYTEKWHHQQQIREAVGQTAPLIVPELFNPCMATFMCALPFAYRNVKAEAGTTIKFTIGDDETSHWFLKMVDNKWGFTGPANANVTVKIPAQTAWQLFTKAITPKAARDASTVKGNEEWVNGIFNMVAVIA